MTYRMGDSYLVDDETGLKIRSSDAVMRWDGLMVHRNVTNPRQPQDLVKAKEDNQVADIVGGQMPMKFIGPLSTKIATAADIGSTRLRLDSAVRMLAGDDVTIMLDNGDSFRTTIAGIVDTEQIDIAKPLPRSVEVGSVLVNYTAVAVPAL